MAQQPLLIGQTSGDVRDVMVKTIRALSPPWFKPRYVESRRSLTWPNGVSALLLSAEDPEQARGPNADLVWADELGAWTRARDAWQNISLALRQGATQSLVTTTPRRIETLVQILGQPTTTITRESTLANRLHLSPEFVEQVLALYRGTRFEQQEIEGRLIDQPEGAWFARFDPAKHVSPNADYVPFKPVEIAIDAGTSRTTAAVIYQTERVDKYRLRFNIIGDYLSVDGGYSAHHAAAIGHTFATLCPAAMLHNVWIDPASSAQTSIGPSALAEYQRIFGERFVNPSPTAPVVDGLDAIEGLLDRGDLVIHPRCVGLIDGLRNYARQARGGQWLDVPALNQSPYEDSVDALRYGVRGTWPEGRRPEPQFAQRPHVSRLFG
jgi:hypothetical protein